jgi:UDPglucose 6-dehydrogenase
VAVLGAAFKPESDDVRDSPALNVAAQIQLQGASVTVYDPKAIENSRRLFPTLSYADSVMSACDRADVVLVLTEWNEFVSLDPYVLGNVVRRRTVIDGRMCLDTAKWKDAGWEYWS